MGFHNETPFVECLGKSTRSGPRQAIMSKVAANGRIVVATRWDAGVQRTKVEIGNDAMSQTKVAAMLTQFHVSRGAAFGFRFRDVRDWSPDSVMGFGDML